MVEANNMMNNASEYNDFLRDYTEMRKSGEFFRTFVSGVNVRDFFKEIDAVNGVALRNLSVKHIKIPNTEKNKLIASKYGLKTTRYSGVRARDLGVAEFQEIVEEREKIADWIKANRPDKLSAFNDLIDALMIEVGGFSLAKAKEVSAGLTMLIKDFTYECNVPCCVYDVSGGSSDVREVVLKKLVYGRSWGSSFSIEGVVVYPDGREGRILIGDLSGLREFNWFVQRDIIPEIMKFVSLSKEAIDRELSAYSDWKKAVKDKLQSYYALLSL